MNRSSHETDEILATREAMQRAGWVYAMDSIPGMYVPDPHTGIGDTAAELTFEPSEFLDAVRRYCRDPDLLSLVADSLKEQQR